jgi:aconitate hydratase
MSLFRTDDTPDPEYTSALELDLGTIEPSVAGPRRPQDRLPLTQLSGAFDRDLPGLLPQGITLPNGARSQVLSRWKEEGGAEAGEAADFQIASEHRVAFVEEAGRKFPITDGSLVIAAITSCTNTSNPSVMVGAGLVAKKAVERGLSVKPWVKTSLAPGSKVVRDYLEAAELLPSLEALGFDIVGYGCTTCIGNSGPLPDAISEAISEHGLVVGAVLSGNRNFEARIHPLVRANYLASPMLVVAFALAGRVDIDILTDPIGLGKDGDPVYLRDIWPSQAEIRDTIRSSLNPEMYRSRYAEVFEGDELWQALPLPKGDVSLYEWDESSTYIQNPPFFEGMTLDVPALRNIVGARVLAYLGDSVTTDHISPAGAIPKNEPAAR